MTDIASSESLDQWMHGHCSMTMLLEKFVELGYVEPLRIPVYNEHEEIVGYLTPDDSQIQKHLQGKLVPQFITFQASSIEVKE